MALACVFPGQGSQFVGMLAGLRASRPEVGETFEEASQALGFDLWQIASEGPEDRLNATEYTQPALLAASVAAFRCYRERMEQPPSLVAGHSLGEYSALVAAGSLELGPAALLVHHRGQRMSEAVAPGQGLMAAVLGLEDEQAETICTSLEAEGYAAVANYNAPGQVVLAGEAAAVRRAAEECKQAGARRVVELAVSVPSHCDLMRPAADALAQEIQDLDLRALDCPLVQNVDARARSDPDEIRANLLLQLYRPVRWRQCVQAMAEAGVETLVECGPGKVLAGLARRIDKSLQVVSAEEACA